MTVSPTARPLGETDRSDLGVAGYDRDPGPWECPRISSLGLQFDAAVEEQRTPRGKVTRPARPAMVRVLGALGGPISTADPERLRYEARRLVAAADLLADEMAPDDVTQPG